MGGMGRGGGGGTTGERRSGSLFRGFCATMTWWRIGGGGGVEGVVDGMVNLQHCGLGVGWGSRWLFGCGGGVCSFSLVEIFDLGR